MEQGGFAEIRRVPKDRASVFNPEYLMSVALQDPKQDKLTRQRLPVDTLNEAVGKIFTGTQVAIETLEQMRRMVHNLDHNEDLDPKVLAIASYLKVMFPANLPINVLSSEPVTNLARTIIIMKDGKDEDLVRLKADILAYYKLLTI